MKKEIINPLILIFCLLIELHNRISDLEKKAEELEKKVDNMLELPEGAINQPGIGGKDTYKVINQ